MESINKTVIVYLVFVLPILFWIYPSFGQNEMRNANLPLQKYRLNVSAVCPNDTNRFWRVTDDLYCQIEIAKKGAIESFQLWVMKMPVMRIFPLLLFP